MQNQPVLDRDMDPEVVARHQPPSASLMLNFTPQSALVASPVMQETEDLIVRNV